MKAVKYCKYNRCKNYKKRDNTYCYVHDRRVNGISNGYIKNVLSIMFLITLMSSMYMYVYVEDVSIYVNKTLFEYKQLIQQCRYSIYLNKYDKHIYEYVSDTVTNVSETCIRVYNELVSH